MKERTPVCLHPVQINKMVVRRGKAAKITIPGLEDDNMVMNPWRPINPFEKSNEPEFVSKNDLEAIQN